MMRIIFHINYYWSIHKLQAFANGSSSDIRLSKTQLYKIGKSGEFLGRLLGPLLKTGLSLMKNKLKPLSECILISLIKNALKQLTKSILKPLGLTAAASATDVAVHQEIFGSGTMTLIISDEEMNKIMKILKSLD